MRSGSAGRYVMSWKMNYSTWHERGIKKISESPTGTVTMTSRTQSGRSVHWTTRTHHLWSCFKCICSQNIQVFRFTQVLADENLLFPAELAKILCNCSSYKKLNSPAVASASKVDLVSEVTYFNFNEFHFSSEWRYPYCHCPLDRHVASYLAVSL